MFAVLVKQNGEPWGYRAKNGQLAFLPHGKSSPRPQLYTSVEAALVAAVRFQKQLRVMLHNGIECVPAEFKE